MKSRVILLLMLMVSCRPSHKDGPSEELSTTPPEAAQPKEEERKAEDIPGVDTPDTVVENPITTLPEEILPEVITTPTPEPEIPDPYVDVVGIKNYMQINETMSSLTGVNANNNLIRLVYDNVNGTLPLTNEIASFNGPSQVAIATLATEYCAVMVDDTALRTQFLPGFNFTLALNNTATFTDMNRTLLVDTLITKFWASLVNRPDLSETRQTMLTLLDLTIKEQISLNKTTATATQNVVKGMCSAVLSSAPVILL